LEAWQQVPAFWLTSTGLLGLCVGSFLNVVIYRLPVMLKAEWNDQCRDYLQLSLRPRPRFDLAFPPSRCPHCGTRIRPWQNLPVLSWLLLRGKAACCGAKISARYPAIELLTGLLFALVAWRFGVSVQAGLLMLMTGVLLALAFIDLDTTYLPDDLTLPLLWLGLLISVWNVFISPEQAIVGAVVGYVPMWAFVRLFEKIKGLPAGSAMGGGDFKLFAVFGAWLGALPILSVVCASAVLGCVGALLIIAYTGKRDALQSLKIPFGPYIVLAGWLALMGWLPAF
jgi:leader peptidase (prepilin peptidase)/N-methyltransferase